MYMQMQFHPETNYKMFEKKQTKPDNVSCPATSTHFLSLSHILTICFAFHKVKKLAICISERSQTILKK